MVMGHTDCDTFENLFPNLELKLTNSGVSWFSFALW